MSDTVKRIFLNVDGVLTSARTYALKKGSRMGDTSVLDPVALKLVQKLAHETEAEIVMFSSWAKMYSQPAQWAEIFESAGVSLAVSEVIPSEDYQAGKLQAIESRVKEGDVYVVFSDDYPWPEHVSAIVVDNFVGLSAKDIVKAAVILAPEAKFTTELANMLKAWF